MTTGDIYFGDKKFISSRNAATLTRYATDYIGQLCRREKIIGRLVGNTWYVEESFLLEHLAKNGLTSKHHGLRSSGSEGPPLFEHIAKNVEAPKHHGLTSFGDMINSEEKIGNADIYANSADLEKSESRLVLKSDERAEEVNLSEPLFPPLKKDKPIEVEIPKKEFQIENHEPIFVQPEAEELVSRSITRSPFVSAELFSKLATMTLSVAIAFSGYQLMSGNVKISSLLPNQASLAATLSSQIGDLSQTIRKDIARISELSQKSAALLSGGNRFFSPDFAYRNLFTDEKISKSMDESAARKKETATPSREGGLAYSIEPLKEIFLKIGDRINSKIIISDGGIYLDYEKEDFAALFGPNTVIHRPAKAGLPAASFFPYTEITQELNKLLGLLKLGASQIGSLFSDTIDRFANFLSAGIRIVFTTIVPAEKLNDFQEEPSLADQIAQIKKEIASLKPQFITVSGGVPQNVIERITPTPYQGRSPDQSVGVEKTIFKTSASGTSQDDLNKLENSLKAEIYRVASNASSQNNATYQAVALTNRINQLANLAISGATITGSTFAGEISATTGGFSGTFSVSGATTLSSTLSAGTTTLTNLAVTNTSTSTFAGPVAHATGDLIIGRGGSGNLLLNPYGGNLGVGTTSPYSMLSVAGQIVGQNYVATSTTATSTFAGRLLASLAPTLAHTFSSWASGASGANPLGAALIINPASATADSNLFAAAVNGSVRFLIDAEGDVFSNSLTTTGIVTLSTTTASTFSVENNTTLGDSITDTTTVNGTLTVTGTTTASTVAGNFGIGTTSPYAKLSVQAGSGDTNQTLFVIASSTSSATTTHFVITNTGFVGIGTTSPGTTLAVAGAGLFNSTLTAFSTITAPSFTATSTTAVSSFQQLLANASTTLQNFTFLNATGTQATTTSFFSTTASSTNLYATSLAVGGATLGNTTIGGTLSVSGLSSLSGGASTTLASIFNTLYIGNTATSTLQGSTTGTSTLQGFLNVAGTNSTSTFSGNLAVNNQATTTSLVVSNNASLGTLAVGGATTLSSTLNVTGLATLANLLSTGSTTLQNFTAVNSTTTNATTTSFFSTTASSTNLYATSLAVGGATLGNTTVGGTLSVSGLSSLSGGASTTLFSSLGPAYFGSTATSSFSTAGALTLASALAVGSGGTGATTLTGLLQGNGTSAITAVTGTAGQFPYFNGASTLAATSTIFLSTGQLVGLGTSTPYSKLSVWGGGTGTGQLFELTNSASTTIAKFLDNGTAYILGNLGIGTTSPYRKLSITDTVSTAQAVIAYDSTRYTELQTNSVGDFIITTQGNDAFLNNDNLWVCTGGACPAGSPTGQGNLIVENRLGVGTSSPYAALSVVGETVSSYFTATSTTATSTFAGAFTITGPTTVQNRLNVANTVGGTVDAITATFLPAFTALTDKTKVTVRATGANTLTTPSFAPDGLTAKTIVKENLVALVAGDIAGAGHEIDLIYNSTADKWVLLNPKATVPLSSKVISFSRDTGLASGNQSITGAGFTPTSAIFVGGVNSTAGRATIGFADSAKSGLGLSPYGDNATIWEIRSNAILTHSGGANYYTGNVFSWDSDGITIAWTRFGSPTGILYVQAILFK